MVSSTLVKLSSPVARSCLVAIGVALLIDSILTIYEAIQYPYLIDHYNDDLYITSSRTIPIAYSAISMAAILLSVSTAFACYKNATNYVLIHAGITGVFLPATILVYFSTISSRYKVIDYIEDYRQMIADYRISGVRRREQPSPIDDNNRHPQEYNISEPSSSVEPKVKLSSFINLIDSMQTKFSCCGLDSAQDWVRQWEGYIAPSCCKERITTTNDRWASIFNVDPKHEFKHCNDNTSYHLGCLVALKEDEQSKYAWLSDLIVFMIVITIANTIVSLLLFGISKTEDSVYDGNEHELSIVGVSSKPRPSQPTITGIRHRPSLAVVRTLGSNDTIAESIGARAQAVRFNMSSSPGLSSTGPSKFSAAARRGSSFI